MNDDAPLPERRTARVVLLDPEGRVLLMQGRLPSNPRGPAAWFTVGGGMEPGESVEEAAAREVLEETGFADVRLGPVVWYSETVLRDPDQRPWHFKENYLVAWCAGGEPSREGWTPLEAELVVGLRWWTVQELEVTGEAVFPTGLAQLLADVIAGRFSPEPLVIRTLEGPIVPPPRPEGR
ncbi:MAG: NUDIX hydrolase [Caulobacterales bacterium]